MTAPRLKQSGISRRSLLKGCLAASLATQVPLAASPAHAKQQKPLPEAKTVKGFCPFCQVRCTYNARIHNGKVLSISGDVGNRWTGGAMCSKGLAMPELINSPHRLTQPMRKTEAGWVNITYEEAVRLTAEKLIAIKAKHGAKIANRIALTSPLWDCRESELAALMTMRLAGGVNIMPAGEVCISTSSNVLNMLLGANTSTTTVNEILNAKMLIIWGANLAETYPVYARWLRKAREAGVKIIYIDPRKTATAEFADIHIRINPGTDGAFALGALRYLLETQAYDAEQVENTTTGLDALRKGAEQWTLQKTAETTGLSSAELTEFFSMLGAGLPTIIWMGGSLCRYTNGVQTIRSIISLQGLTGNLIGPGRGLLTMEGGKPEGEKEFIDAVCGTTAASGMNFRRLLNALKQKQVDLVFLNSSFRRYPDCNAVKKALKDCPFVVYRGFFNTEEMEVADLFVPATFSLESDGSHYGAEKQVVWREKGLNAPGACVPDWQFYRDVGMLIEPDKYPYFATPEELCAKFNKTVESWHGFNMASLRSSPDGQVWPLPQTGAPERIGSIFEHGKLETEDGKLNFALPTLGGYGWAPPRSSPLDPKAAKEFPLTLIQGKIVTQWQQTVTNFSASLAGMLNGRSVQVHPSTAKELGLTHGDRVKLETSLGGLEAWVDVTENTLPGVVFTASHFVAESPFASTRDKALNSILPNNWDRVSAQFNGTGCRLVKA